ncbi:MAG: hypothetical protein AAB305_05505 [Candidatus Zixiibacteriota bacterium]
MKRLFVVGVLVGCIAPICRAIDLTLVEFPSEDEIVEAFQSGEIGEEEMQTSRDALFAYEFGYAQSVWDGDLADRQWHLGSFDGPAKSTPSNSFHGKTTMRYRYQQAVSDDARTRYQIRGHSQLAPHWQLSAGIDRDLSGRERVRYRSISYSNKTGNVRQVAIGNFSERLGLGSVFGTRGKILGRSGDLDEESVLIPDYGGGNGFYSQVESRGWHITALTSAERDTANSHTIAAMNLLKQFAHTEMWITTGNSWLGSRNIGSSHSVKKIAIGATHRTSSDRISAEVTAQNDESLIPASGVIEGSAKRGDLTVTYSGWVYHDDFVDDASGSRSGSLRHTWRDTASGIEWTTRRSGTEGGIVKSHWTLPFGWGVSTTFLVSAWKSNYSETRFAANIDHDLSSSLRATGEYLQRNNNRVDDKDELVERLIRLGMRYDRDDFAMRTAFGITTRDSAHYLSCLCTGHIDLDEFGRVEWWVDIRRLGVTPGTADYGYVYAQFTEQWSRSVETAVKVSTRYDSKTASGWSSTISIDVGVSL